jgi:hypothetical protein
MLIIVKTLTGRKVNFEVTDDMTIYDLKQEVSAKEGIEMAQIRMIFAGSQLNDTLRISETKIKAGDIIHLVLSLRGG